MDKTCEVLIIGGGITGLTIARELLTRGIKGIVVIEKERCLGAHASGRNSGVLHAGIYYTPDSFKAQFCAKGNALMKGYCRENGLTLKETGKVIVTKDSHELERLFKLHERAIQNGVRSSIIDTKELSEIEPFAATCEKALYSPDTAVIDPNEILNSIKDELLKSGKVKIYYETSFFRLKGDKIALTSQGAIEFHKVVNTSGAFADRVAHQFGVGRDFKILPFKGTYKKIRKERSYLVRGNIYPVPDLRNTFLGIHFTRSAMGEVYAGPTAIPALGRENYGFFEKISLEMIPILFRDGILFLENEAFRSTAITEVKKYSMRFFFEEAKQLLTGLEITDLEDTNKIGIRAQLVHWPTKKLVMDFVLIREGDSLHVLNAISPAFTSSMAFAKYAVDKFLG
ncbi:MAG: L-2-hydroxyglutarate oxidase [Thermodesulfobacteriota bacterium]